MINVRINGKTWQCSVMSTREQLLQGLSGVASIPSNTGMLFDMGVTVSNVPINMSQMLFPLDIVFFTQEGIVVDAITDVNPGDEYTCQQQFRYFMEVNAGEISGISIADRAYFDSVAEPLGLDSETLQAMMALGVISLFMAVVKRLAYNSNPKRKKEEKVVSPEQKNAEQTLFRQKNEDRLAKREKEMTEQGQNMASATGTTFIRLDQDWRWTRAWWFRDSTGREIVANSLEDLQGKLIALDRFKKK